MHILHIIPYYAPAWAFGGPVRVATEVATRMAARGHRLSVLTTDSAGPPGRLSQREEVLDGVQVMRLPNLNKHLAWRRLFVPVGFRAALAHLLPGVDLVHLHEFRSLLSAWALEPLQRAGIPYILSPHGGLPMLGRSAYKRVFDAAFGRRLIDRAAALHAITPMEAAQYRVFGVDPNRIALIPNGIDADLVQIEAEPAILRAELGIGLEQPMILFLARLNAIKGPDLLIEAFTLIAGEFPEAVLVLAGPDDGMRDELRQRADALGIAQRLRWLGLIEGEARKVALYRAADLYVLPSRYEILGISALEALAQARPLILSDACGIAGPLEAAGAAVIASVEDVESLAAALRHLLADPQAARQMGQRGQALALAEYAWDGIADRWEVLYQACAKGRTLA